MIGQTINNYVLERKLGEGGMGEVYFARHNRIDRVVAIKTLHKNLFDNVSIRHRFKNEANALIKLLHPNIVKIYDYVEQDNFACLIMEYIDGYTLEDYLNKVIGPLPEANAISIVCSVLDAVQYAHENNIYHRDIKPGNIMVSRDGRVVRIMDFSIAKFTDGSSFKTTHANAQLGTPFYMSPEQVKGLPYTSLSDIYSIGVTLYEMVTGKCPYCEITNLFELQSKIVNEPLPPTAKYNASVPVVIQDAIKIATSKLPENRFTSCTEFKNYLLKPTVKQDSQQQVKGRGLQEELGKTAVIPTKQAIHNYPKEKVAAEISGPDNKNRKVLRWPYLAVGGVIIAGIIIYFLTVDKPVPPQVIFPTNSEVIENLSGKVFNKGIQVKLPGETKIQFDTLISHADEYKLILAFATNDSNQKCIDTVYYKRKENQYIYENNSCSCDTITDSTSGTPPPPTIDSVLKSLNYTINCNGTNIPLWNDKIKDSKFNDGNFNFTFEAVATKQTCTLNGSYNYNGSKYAYQISNCNCSEPPPQPPLKQEVINDIQGKLTCPEANSITLNTQNTVITVNKIDNKNCILTLSFAVNKTYCSVTVAYKNIGSRFIYASINTCTCDKKITGTGLLTKQQISIDLLGQKLCNGTLHTNNDAVIDCQPPVEKSTANGIENYNGTIVFKMADGKSCKVTVRYSKENSRWKIDEFDAY